MKVKARIKNFRIVEDSSILIEGITGLVGESNHGKTALYSAIKTLVLNIAGTSYIRHGSKSVQIGLSFQDSEGSKEDSIVYKRADSPMYLVNGVKFEKVGRTVPDDVKKLLNMNPVELGDSIKINLNFYDQLSEPLLLKLSETNLYNLTIKSFDGEKVNESIKLAKVDMDDIGKTITSLGIEHGVQKKSLHELSVKLEKFSLLEQIKPYYQSYKAAMKRVIVARELLGQKSGIEVVKDKYIQLLTELQPVESLYLGMHEAQAFHFKVELLGAFQKDIRTISEVRIKLEQNQARLVDLKEIEEKLDYYDVAEKKLKEMKTFLGRHDFIVTSRDLLPDLEKFGYLLEDYDIKVVNFKERLFKIEHWMKVLFEIRKEKKNIEFFVERDNDLNNLEVLQKEGKCPVCEQDCTNVNHNKNMDAEFEKRLEFLRQKKQETDGKLSQLSEQEQALIKEIRDAGFDPEKLETEKIELEAKIGEFEEKAKPIVDQLYESVVQGESNLGSAVKNSDYHVAG